MKKGKRPILPKVFKMLNLPLCLLIKKIKHYMENERYDRLCSRISIYMKRQYASFSQSLKHCLSNVDKELKKCQIHIWFSIEKCNRQVMLYRKLTFSCHQKSWVGVFRPIWIKKPDSSPVTVCWERNARDCDPKLQKLWNNEIMSYKV